MELKIVAVVVTYNRKELLKECLDAIRNQTTQIEKIVVIDNNSTDKTYEELSSDGYLDDNLIFYKKLEKNIGGSGGFHIGFKEAQQFNPDWIWIMDDDTIPKVDCLEKLQIGISNIDDKVSFVASSIYGTNNEPMNVPTVNQDPSVNGYCDWYKYLKYGIVKIKEATFVSLLINYEAVQKCGYPCKDYFIWGDDTEYTLRLNKFYGNSYMIGNSIAIHKRKLSKSLTIVDEDNPNRITMYYYMVRNNLINLSNYKGKKAVIKNIIGQFKNIIKIIIRSDYKIKKISVTLKGIFSFIFRKYDYKAFKNRLDVNVKYRKF